jgi:hypothetical protein
MPVAVEAGVIISGVAGEPVELRLTGMVCGCAADFAGEIGAVASVVPAVS